VENNLDLEVKIISAMFQFENCQKEALNYLKDTDFVNDKNKIIFNAIKGIVNDKKIVDLTTIIEFLNKNNQWEKIESINYLQFFFENYIEEGNVFSYIKLLCERTMKRNLSEILNSTRINLFSNTNIFEVISLLEKNLVNLKSERVFSDNLLPIKDGIYQIFTNLKSFQEKKINNLGVASGIDELDKITGGFQKGDFIVLAGRPSIGKTALALNFLFNASSINSQNGFFNEKEIVVIFSLEISREQVMQRILASKSETELNIIRGLKLKMITNVLLKNLEKNIFELEKSNIFIDDTSGLKIQDLETKLLRLTREGKIIKFVVIDYLQLLIENKEYKTKQEEVASISKKLKNLARDLQIPILCLSQLSRNVEKRENKKPIMSDLRESGAIEQDADLILFLFRESYYNLNQDQNQDKKFKYEEEMELIIAKHRHGEIADIKLIFSKKYNKFFNFKEKEYDFKNN
jgi:replicative DNA helicase